LFGQGIAYDPPGSVTYRGQYTLQIGVIVFDYAPMPFNFVVERILSLMAGISNSAAIAYKSVPITARKFIPETSLLGFVDV
jgi:hypothetical protein